LTSPDKPLEPIWDGEHYNTFEVNLGTWTGQVEFDHKPTDEELIDAVMERIAESYMDFNRHGRFAIDELTLIGVEDV
jgi:hypothetical protein